METSEQYCETKKYCKYTRQMRLQLIKMVDQDHISTAHAARFLGIKQTSACRILRSYHHHHRIFEKKSDRICRERVEAYKNVEKEQKFSKKFFQQKKNAPQEQQQSQRTLSQETQKDAILSQKYQQNDERRVIDSSSEGIGVLLHPIFNFSAECFPFYNPGYAPFTYAYLA